MADWRESKPEDLSLKASRPLNSGPRHTVPASLWLFVTGAVAVVAVFWMALALADRSAELSRLAQQNGALLSKLANAEAILAQERVEFENSRRFVDEALRLCGLARPVDTSLLTACGDLRKLSAEPSQSP